MGQRTNNATWKRIRLEILSRDGWVCSYCGQDATEVDHIIPVKHGGTDDEANLTAACVKCNRSKGTKAKPGKAQHGPKVRFFVGPFPHPPAGDNLSPMVRIGPPNA
jgi:5-methylcytosine-specific restriction endonuclease McrA